MLGRMTPSLSGRRGRICVFVSAIVVSVLRPARLAGPYLLFRALLEGHGEAVPVGPPQDMDLEGAVGALEGLVEGVDRARRAPAGLDDEVAFLDAGSGGPALLLDGADEQAVDLGTPHSLAEAPGHVRRDDPDAEERADRRRAIAGCGYPVTQ